MRSRNQFLFCVLLFLLLAPMYGQTVDELIAKNIQAKGGMDKIKAMRTRRMSGKVVSPGGFEYAYIQVNERPGSVREDSIIQGMNIIQAYDGKEGWQIDPTQGKKTAEGLSEDDLRAILEDADFDGPLVDYKEKGNTVQLLGKEEDVDGSPAYRILVKQKNGDIKNIYLDEDAFLEVKIETKRNIRGAERESEVVLGDYKAVGGVMMPYSLEQKPKGAPQAQKVIFQSIEANPAVPKGFFQVPATPQAATK